MRCHLRHMFSRWIDGQRYRNSIKIGGSPPPARPCAPLGIDPISIKLRRFSYEIPTSRALAPSRFFMAVCPSSRGALTARGMGTMSSQARVLERPDRVPARNGSKTAEKPSAYCDQPSATSATSDPQDWAATQVREWLLLILRFAVTSDPKDQSAALALADEIDARGLAWRPSAPSFFRRTSNDVCKAIASLDDPKSAAILKRHLARIDNPALRRAFRAAVNFDERTAPSQRNPRNLWFGLSR
jgi:hypothetical protein